MACTQQPHYPEIDLQENVAVVVTAEEEKMASIHVHQPEFAPATSTTTIRMIEIKAPKCFREESGGEHWERLWASYDKVRSVYNAMIYCSLPYTARMIMYSYMGFSKLFSSFCNDKNDETAIDVFISTHREFDESHRILLKSDVATIASVIRTINSAEDKVSFSLPMQERFALQIRQIFTFCTVNDRVESTENPLFINLHNLPLFQDEQYSFDILWKYSQKPSPIQTYACIVLEKLVRVLKDGLYKIAQCMVLFFVYTLKMVCKLIERSHDPVDASNIKHFHKQLYSRLNAKLIKVFSNFVNIVGASSQHTNYEKNLREEQRRGALDTPIDGTTLMALPESSAGNGGTCLLS